MTPSAGENPSKRVYRKLNHIANEVLGRVYSGTRMDTIWAFRQGSLHLFF